MTEPLLTTKLYSPSALPAAKVVSRPRLIERLNQGLARSPGLTLVSAPAGFGKTTLITQWLHQDAAGSSGVSTAHPSILLPFCWLSLDKDDNDPHRFLTYLVGALQRLHPDMGEAVLSLLQSPQPPPTAALLTTLVNEIAGIRDRFILILDDYHLIEVRPVHEALAFLLDHLPPPMHLVITSRVDLPLPLARLRGQGLLTELRADDLRFSPAETADFLNDITGLGLPADDVALLDQRTEGWIVGLQLAALSLQGKTSTDQRDFLTAITGSDRYIADYLIEEVLQHQPAAIQMFLLQTSILERLCAPLCDAVLEWPNGDAEAWRNKADFGLTPQISNPPTSSQDLLDYLDQANLFIVPLDNQREWYRYHHLFAELLQSRLQRSQPALISLLHGRASAWYEADGQKNESINHALRAGDYARASRLISQNSRDMLKRGEVSTLARWLKALPAEIVRSNPQLSLASAWALMLTGPFKALEPVLQEFEASLQAAKTTIDSLTDAATNRQSLLSEMQAIGLIAAIERGDTTSQVIDAARQVLNDLPGDHQFLSSSLATSLAIAYRANGDTNAAIQTLTQARAVAQQSDNLLSLLIIDYELAGLRIEHGQLRQAETIHNRTLKLVEERFGPGAQHIPMAGAAYIGLGNLSYERNDLASARQQLETGIALTHQKGGLGLARDGSVAMAFVHQAQGDVQAANRWMEEAEEMAHEAPRPEVMAQVLLSKAQLSLMQGNLTQVRRWAQERNLDIRAIPAYADEMAYLILVRLYLAQANRPLLQPAVTVLAKLRQRVEAQQRQGQAIEITLLQALIYRSLDDIGQALQALEYSLSRAEPEGYLRRFVDEGPLLLDLLQLALARRLSPTYTTQLLAVCKAEQLRLSAQSEAQPLTEPLTGRELEVIQLIASGLSNKAIAESLFITVGTVKRHTMNIYGKLGVNSRTQAVVKAREVGLIE